MTRDQKQPDTHRMVSARPALPAHLLRWKYADPSGRIVYRDAPDPALRLIREPEGQAAPVKPAPSKSIEPEPE
jgi:hypothetical protein